MKVMTYEEAKEYAASLKEDDLWIFEHDGEFGVIRGFAYKHYCSVPGWIPRAHITLKVEILEMFTGVRCG